MRRLYTTIFLIIMYLLLPGCRTRGTFSSFEISSLNPNTSDFVIPTPTSETGVVIGQLLTAGSHGQPYLATLYLATFVYPIGNSDAPPLISFSEKTSIRGVQDPKTGYFYFSDVPPGKYSIIIWTPVMSMPLRDPKTGSEISFEVKAGKVTNLGLIIIT